MAYCHPMAQESSSRDLDKVIVRLPDGMRARIKAAASGNNRSMNAEIVATLEEKYPQPRPGLSFEEVQEIADSIAAAASEQERDEKIMAGNRMLAASGLPIRLAVRKGVVQMVTVGPEWVESMAMNDIKD